jgi:hypothetical protein
MNNPKRFDIVVGNPPYQKSENNSQKLWPKFVKKSFEICKKEGIVALITPPTWLNRYNSAGSIIKNKDIKEVNFECKKYFSVGSSFSYYIISNSKNNKAKTIVTFVDGSKRQIVIDADSCFSTDKSSLFIDKLIRYPNKFSCIGIGNQWRSDSYDNVSKNKDENYKYELFHTNSYNLFCKIQHPYQFHKKVILNQCSTWSPFYSDKIGFTHLHLAILVNNESDGKKIAKYLNSKIISAFIKTLDVFSGARIKDTLYSIPKIDNLECIEDMEYVKNCFGLTDEEILFINGKV